jgi:putative ABC transport system substrate-binding protein
MRRRDLTIGLLLATAVGRARAQEPAKQHRIAIVIPTGPVAVINETSSDTLSRRFWQPFFEELRRLGNIEGQNLIVERYSGEGKPDGYADLAREATISAPIARVGRCVTSSTGNGVIERRWSTTNSAAPASTCRGFASAA